MRTDALRFTGLIVLLLAAETESPAEKAESPLCPKG